MPDIFVNSDLGEQPKMNAAVEEKHDHKHSHPKVSQHKHMTVSERHALPGHTRNPLASFCYYPEHVHFVGADEQEKIVLLLRRHPITNIKWILVAIFMLFAPLLVSFAPFVNSFPVNMQIMLLLFWYLVTVAFILEQFLTWFFNVYIVTDERVFDVDFHNLVYREITDANLEQIQDVTVRVGSFIRTIFGYGDILIQTASEMPQIEFDAVPQPDRVAEILRELRVEEEIEKLEGRVR